MASGDDATKPAKPADLTPDLTLDLTPDLTPDLTQNFDLSRLAVEFYADPYPTYRQLRQQAPVYALPGGGYFLSRYEDLREVYRDPARFSSDKRVQFAPVFGADSLLFQHHTTSLVFNDPPLHTRVRRAIGNALSQNMLQAMQAGLQTVVDDLLAALQQQSRADLISQFAAAIPVEIIGNLLRIPADQRGPLRRWSLAILGALEVGLSEAARTAGETAVREFIDYLTELVASRELSDDQDDILARLLKWRDDQGRGLDATELYHQCIFLLNAGHETTTNLIGNGIELLTRYPDSLAALQADPALWPGAIEEILRFESSNQLGNRLTTCQVQLRGQTIPAGSVLTLCIGAANRDADVFSDAEHFDIRRSPNPHLAFGAGIHTCAGLHVARLEGLVALRGLFSRFPQLQLEGVPVRLPRARFRGFAELPARLHQED